MTTSFAWGTLAFGDSPRNMGMSILGLVMLVAGVALVSRAGYLSCLHSQESSEACNAAAGCRGLSSLLAGVLYALGAGVADGSLVAFYQHLERTGSFREHTSLAALLCSYFGSFGIVALLSGVIIAVWTHTVNSMNASGDGAAPKRRFNPTSFVSGAISGSMWAGANSCSVLASHFLGMALAFPITQTAVAFSGLLGVLVFGEIVGSRARTTFTFALVTILAGAVVLSQFGQPS